MIRIEKVLFAVKDIDGFDEIQKALDNLKEETEKWLKSNFEQWRDQAMSSILQGDLMYVFHFCMIFFATSRGLKQKYTRIFNAYNLSI